MTVNNLIPALSIVNGIPTVSSLDVAEHFGKRHSHLTRSIQSLDRNSKEFFDAPIFGRVEYVDSKGEKRIYFWMTEEGFSALVMGFTGQKALRWKFAYIKAFKMMRDELLARAVPPLAAKPARPKAVKADKLVKITRNVLAAEVKAGVRAVCKSMGRDPAVGDYNIAYRNARVACHVFRWASITDAVAADNLDFLRGKVDEQLKVYEKCKGCTKVVMDWRPISPDGKHVIVQAVVKEELPAAEPKELPRVTTGAERKPLAIAVNQMIGANDEGPTRQKYMQFWRALNGVLGLNSIEELTADRLPAVQKLVELIASMVATPATTPLPGALPGDFAALAPADQVSVLLDAYEKSTEFAQGNAWAIEAKLLDILKGVDIGPGMDHMQGMQVRQMINDLRIGFVHAMQPIQASLNAIRPLFWMLAAASKLGQRKMAMLPS